MIGQRVLDALDLSVTLTAGSFDLAIVDGKPVTVTAELSQDALDLAARRRTGLLAVVDDGRLEPLSLRGGYWPIIVVSDSPWSVVGADLGLLVGVEGPADSDGLTEQAAAQQIRRFLDLAFDASPQPAPGRAPLLDVVPFALDASYDMATVIDELVDRGQWMELQAETSNSVITGIARIEGRSVGVMASVPRAGGGLVDAEACARIDRLVSFCERSGRPLVSLVDTQGLVALARRDDVVAVRDVAARMRRCDVIKVVVVVGHAVGFGATIMGAVGARANVVLPWPRASFSLLAPDPASDDPSAGVLSSAFRAAREGDVMDILDPGDTRERIAEMLGLLRGRRDYAATGSPS